MTAEKADRQSGAEATERIVVALDASPSSVTALRAAAELASWLGMELEGLFVEDINLTRLCGFPNLQEVGSYTGAVRRLDDRSLERQLRALASAMRQQMAREAQRRPVRWNFQVRRGPVVAELLAASQSASVVSLGRTSRGHRRTLGSTAQSVVRKSSRPVLILGDQGELRSPLTVVYTGSEGSERALRFAVNLHQRRGAAILVLVWGGERAQQLTELIHRADALLRQEGVEATVLATTGGELGAILSRETGALVLPRENAALLAQLSGPVILVP